MMITVGIDFLEDNIMLDGKNYKFKIFDTAGAERYKSSSRSIIRVSDGFIIVFSVDNRKSFQLANDDWLRFIKEETLDIEKKVIFLVANKIDLEKREVKREEAEEYAKRNKMNYFEISARKGIGVKEIFNQMYKDVYDLYKNSTINYSKNSENKANNSLKKKNKIFNFFKKRKEKEIKSNMDEGNK